MGVVHEPIKDGIGNGAIAEVAVPLVERQLAGDERCGAIVSIVEDLFIGNKLASGKLRTSDGAQIDFRNIKSPILVFCSKGDNITPPQQALGWILDLSGGMSTLGWGLAFLHLAVVALIGQIGFTLLRPRDLAGDRSRAAAR